jgi:hypothetical protein
MHLLGGLWRSLLLRLLRLQLLRGRLLWGTRLPVNELLL